MDIPQTLPIKKSDSHSFNLPSISKTQSKIPSYRTARVTKNRHHSVFIDKIKDLAKDVRYEEMETTMITQQHNKLKGMLRQFNHETYHILSRYIDKPVEAESSKRTRVTSTSMMQIKDKQLENSNDALQICRRQMELLQRKCQNLKYVTVEGFQRKIESIKSQIEELKNSNKQIIKGNTLRGLSIKRGDSKTNHEVSQIEQQKFILEKKKERLTEDMNFVNQEQEKLKQNHNKADEQIKKMIDQYNKHEKDLKETSDQKQLIKTYSQKKKQYEIKKQRSQSKAQMLTKQEKGNKIILSQQKQAPKNNEQQNQSPQKATNQLKVNVVQKSDNSDANKDNKKQQVKPPNKHQFQYLKLLKQLDEITKRLRNYDENAEQLSKKVQNSRKNIQEHQLKLSSMKKLGEGQNLTQVNDKNKDSEKHQEKAQSSDKKWSLF